MRLPTLSIVALVLLSRQARAQGDPDPAPPRSDLTELSLEDLMGLEVEVTSVSKRAQSLASSAAAIFVLTGEDIRRSGARSIPEALRMVPGLAVARINGSTWAISARGFNGQFANKMLVLIDGRSVYTPSFSGVYWDLQDVLLEDIERIEVIRGPGAALWGANAVNGVINVITKPAGRTQGTFVELGGGTEERFFGSVRHGGELPWGGHYRVYAKGFERAGLDDHAGTGIEDDWNQGRAGFRGDWSPAERDTLTLQGDVYRSRSHWPLATVSLAPPFTTVADMDADSRGANLLARWTRTVSESSDFTLQAYYDLAERDDGLADQREETLDIDYQHHLRTGPANDLLLGLGYRRIDSELAGGYAVSFDPERRTDELLSAFAQDEIGLVEGRLSLILGAKVEHNDYTGTELQPSARCVWTPGERHTLWASVSRAVRTPSRVEDDGSVNFRVLPDAGFVDILRAEGQDGFESEELVAHELGWRFQPREDLSFDLATFYHVYDGLRSFEPGTPFLEGGNVVIPFAFSNTLHGTAWGAELAAEWHVREGWRLRGAYTLLKMSLVHDAGSQDSVTGDVAGESPENQASLRSTHDLGETTELDLGLYYVDSLPGKAVPSYVRADVRLGWRPRAGLDLSLVGQSLFHDGEFEYAGETFGGETAMDAGAYLVLSWRF